VIEITWNAAPCYKQAHWFSDGRFARISHKTHPIDARWYARVISEGQVRSGDGVAVSPLRNRGSEASARTQSA
jgi:MOSC domain-containing protein YiiM